jgi:hypothetical protein
MTYSFAVDKAQRDKFIKKNKLMRNDMLRAAMIKINNTLPDE